MIALAFVAGILLPAFLFVAAPGSHEPMFGWSPWYHAAPAVGFVGNIVGLAWMVRIYRAEAEPDQHAWRYRAKR